MLQDKVPKPVLAAERRESSAIPSYIQLTKPSIMLLVLITGATSLILEGSLLADFWAGGVVRFCLVLLALMLSGGSANAFNMYLERDIDSRMDRTRRKRPLPLGIISPRGALVFAIIIGLAGVIIFAAFFNILSAILALVTIAFYAFFYTLYLKPRTHFNIVIGGAAGSMAPIIAWAAVQNGLAMTPILLSALVFFWTPPHFWALALHLKEDYEAVNYPMLPVVKGDRAAKRQILYYVLILAIVSGTLLTVGAGLVYCGIALVAGAIFIRKATDMQKAYGSREALDVFRYSIIYLLVIFTGLIIDSAIKVTL